MAAEIWTTGTTFKGFTKQERFKLQQMGGNCAAKVVEVIKDAPPPAGSEHAKPAPARRRKRPAVPTPEKDRSKMQVRVRLCAARIVITRRHWHAR